MHRIRASTKPAATLPILSTNQCIIIKKKKQHKTIRCSAFHQNTAKINGCFVCKKFCAYDVLFWNLSYFGMFLLILERVVFSFLYKLHIHAVFSLCLFILCQFYSTCYEHISHCAFFGSKFWREIGQVFQTQTLSLFLPYYRRSFRWIWMDRKLESRPKFAA